MTGNCFYVNNKAKCQSNFWGTVPYDPTSSEEVIKACTTVSRSVQHHLKLKLSRVFALCSVLSCSRCYIARRPHESCCLSVLPRKPNTHTNTHTHTQCEGEKYQERRKLRYGFFVLHYLHDNHETNNLPVCFFCHIEHWLFQSSFLNNVFF